MTSLDLRGCGLADYVNKSIHVQAIRVTEKNMYDVSQWCGGDIVNNERGLCIRVHALRPKHDGQTYAGVGSWILRSNSGFKVYTNMAFKATFRSLEVVEAGKRKKLLDLIGDAVRTDWDNPDRNAIVSDIADRIIMMYR